MRDVAEKLRARQRDWLLKVTREHGIKPTPLAKAAGVAATTITRKLNDPNDTAILTDLTIARICEFLKIEPPNFLGEETPSARPRGFAEPEASPYLLRDDDPMRGAIEAAIGKTFSRVAWELRGRALEHEGYRAGDVLIVDLNELPQAGDIVCAQIYNWQNPSQTETVFRLYEKPYLVVAGHVEGSRRPLAVDGDNVMIKGVIVGMVRRPQRPDTGSTHRQ